MQVSRARKARYGRQNARAAALRWEGRYAHQTDRGSQEEDKTSNGGLFNRDAVPPACRACLC